MSRVSVQNLTYFQNDHSNTGWERTGHMLCIVDTSLSVSMTLRMCLRELCCLSGILYCFDLNHLVRVFNLFVFS